MNQLHLSESELKDFGFIERTTEGKKFFELPGINSSFIYNPDEPDLTWYHKTVIMDAANWLHLDIRSELTLINVLQIFRSYKT